MASSVVVVVVVDVVMFVLLFTCELRRLPIAADKSDGWILNSEAAFAMISCCSCVNTSGKDDWRRFVTWPFRSSGEARRLRDDS